MVFSSNQGSLFIIIVLGGVVLDNNSTKREWISGLYSKNNDINIHMKNENCKCRDVKHKNKNECADWSK